MMSSAVDQVCNKNTVGGFEKIHKASELQAAWSSPHISTADFTTVSKEPARAFTPFKKPLKPTPTSDLVGGELQQPAATNSVEGSGHPECNISDPPLVNGPSTPMRYVPRPKNAPAEMPGNRDPFSLSLGTGVSCSEGRELEQKENFTDSNRVGTPKGLTYYRHHPMKPNQPALNFSKNSQRKTVPELRQGDMESHKENMLSLSLAKPESLKPFVQKSSESDYHRTFGSIVKSKTSTPEGNDMQHQIFSEQVSFQTINSVDCSSANMADNRQSSRNISNACVPGQPLTCTFSALMCGSTLQESAFALQNNVFEVGMLTPAGRTSQQPTTFNTPMERPRPTTFNTPMESLNYIPILQTPLMANGGGHRRVSNEGNLNLHCNDYSISGKKRKSLSYTKQESDSSGRLTWEKDCLLKVREQLEGSENSQEEKFSQKRHGSEHVDSPHDSANRDSSKNHIIFNGNVETEFPGTEKGNKVGVPNTIMSKLGELPEPVALELHCKNAVNYPLGNTGDQVSLMPDMNRLFELKLGNISTTSSSGGTEVFPNQSINKENTLVSRLNGHQCRSLGSRLLTFPAYSPMPTALSTFSSGDPSLPQSLVDTSKRENSCAGDSKITQRNSPMESNWGKFLALSTAQVDQSKKEALVPYQQRFINLQAFLKQCDEPNEDHLRTIRSLSASGRSGHAVDLETRAIMLSLEEVKELRRMKMLNVFGKGIPKGSNDAGATPQGPRLPAPGATHALKLVTGS